MTEAIDPNTEPVSPIAVGDLLNGIFRIKRFIARGGMGEVFEGVNINTDEIVAIKVMLPAFAANPSVELMFRNEARILTKLSHPALVHYRVLAREPNLGLLYIVMDYIDGVSLSDVMDSIGATTAELIGLTRRLADGLRSAHRLGAIHRDLSPDNVLLERGRLERARIVDFGIARNLNPAEGLITIEGFSGKIGFAAPEQLGEFGGVVGPWTDVYGLGLMILSLSLGRKFDFGGVLDQAIEKRRAPLDLSLVQNELRPLLQAMLVADPAARLRSMDEVIEALDRNNYQQTLFALPGAGLAKPGQPIEARPSLAQAAALAALPNPVTRSQSLLATAAPKQRPRVLQIAAVAGGVAIALIAGWWWLYSADQLQAQRLTAVRMAIAKTNCAWLDLSEVEAGNSADSITVKGAANDPAGLKQEIASAIADIGGTPAINVAGVGPLDPSACALIDTVRMMRSERRLLASAQSLYPMRLDGAPSLPGKVAVRTQDVIEIGEIGRPFAVYTLTLTGDLALLMNRESLPTMIKAGTVERIGQDRFRLNHDIASTGWSGLMLVTRQDQSGTRLLTMPASQRTKAWYTKVSAEAVKGGWQADMIWFETKDNNAA